MTEEKLYGDFVTIDTKPVLELKMQERMLFFWAMLRVYQQIVLYKTNFRYSDDVTTLIPLAITDNLTMFDRSDDAQEKIITFCYALLCKMRIVCHRKGVKKELAIMKPEHVSNLELEELLESLELVVNKNRGNDYVLHKLLPTLKRGSYDIADLMAEYAERDTADFEETIFKMGYCKK